ncbi:MAG: DNA methyltransferase, partial [Pseudomonadota bacterium]
MGTETFEPIADPQAMRDFIDFWSDSGGGETANFQTFIKQLTDLLGIEEDPKTHAQVHRNDYSFERGVKFKDTGATGRIDLYRRDCFVMEAKQSKKRIKTDARQAEMFGEDARQKSGTAVRGTKSWDKTMRAARNQAIGYARALPVDHGYPPFVIVVDVGNVIELYADFSGQGKNYAQFPDRRSYRLSMEDLLDPAVQHRLRSVWLDPQSLNPALISARVTRDIAERLARIAKTLEGKHDAETVAHFLMRCLFTMFAEDVGLIPKKSFEDLLEQLKANPQGFVPTLEALWKTMDEGGYSVAIQNTVRHFNGGLFADCRALPLEADAIHELHVAAKRDWSDVEPAIFGTLLEQALDPRERGKLGAHYTPRAYVERLVIPTIIEPLRQDWESVQSRANELHDAGNDEKALNVVRDFHRKLCMTRVLDPACGTGNFLYVALELMKRLEGEVLELIRDLGGQPERILNYGAELEAKGLLGQYSGSNLARKGGRFTVSPSQFFGLDLNERAVVIADLVLWLGYIKWQLRTSGLDSIADPVLERLGNIRHQDAILAYDGKALARDEDGEIISRWDGFTTKPHPVTGNAVPDPEARVESYTYDNPKRAPWPEAEFIVGNPPFIGGKDLRAQLGDGEAEAIWAARPKVPGGADFVMHFWEEAATRLSRKPTKAKPNPLRRFGFITTNSITQTFSHRVVEAALSAKSPISLVLAVPDHPWMKASDKAAVRIAMTVAERGEMEGVLGTVVKEEGLGTDAPLVVLSTDSGKVTGQLTLGTDFSKVSNLLSNEQVSFKGYMPWGKDFWISLNSPVAKELRAKRPDALIEYYNGRDIAQRPRGVFAIDLFETDINYVRENLPIT